MRERGRQSGFTLVEMVLSITLLGIVGVLVGSLFVESIKTFSLISDRRGSLEDARIVSEKMKREIELIRDTTDIATFTNSKLKFSLPSEGNITYTLIGTNLKRNSDVLADNVASLGFNYLDLNGDETSTADNIRRIRFEFVINTAQNHGIHRVRSQVFLRNTYYVDFQ